MKIDPKIAVVIPTINRKDKLKNCLRKLQEQNFPNLSIYVVNNASNDGTEQMLKAEFPEVVALNFKEMLGSAGGYKKGLEKALADGADWFWLMDDDAWPEKNALEILVKTSGLDESKAFAAVALDEENPKDLAWSNELLVAGKKQKATQYAQLGKKDLVESAGIGYLGLLISKRILLKVGFPDEKMFTWVDDVDYFLRIRKDGFRMFYVRKSIIFHPKPTLQEINFLFKKALVPISTPWKEYYGIRNSVYLWLKHESKVKVLLFKLPKQIIFYLIVILNRDLKSIRLQYYFKAFRDGLTNHMGLTLLPGTKK